MAAPDLPPSFIFEYARFDEEDPVDTEMALAHRQLMETLQGRSEIEIHNDLQVAASSSMPRHGEIINGLLYGILISDANNNNNNPQLPVNELFRLMNFVARDSLSYALRQTRHFCSHLNFHRIRPQVKQRLVWLVDQLTEVRVPGVDQLHMCLLRQIRGGDVSPPNIQLADAMVDLLHGSVNWLYSFPVLVAYSCYTFLRIMLDHNRNLNLREKEARFCARLLRERFRDCSDIGRDLVRAMQDVARIREMEEIWVDLLYKPERLNPQLEGVHQLMAMPSKDIYLASRLTFAMEHKLLFILRTVPTGGHTWNLKWFVDRYLSAPETDALYCDIIRYICGVYHPTNAILASPIVPRYVVIGGLMRSVKSNVAAANIKLALFFDWLFYDPAMDNIMNIEPAMLLMEKSVERYGYLTAILLEFLSFVTEHYYPPLREEIQRHVRLAGESLVDKGVIRSFRVFYDSPYLEPYPPCRDYIRALFPRDFADLADATPGDVVRGTSMENLEEHPLPKPEASPTNESADEFDNAPTSFGAGQNGSEEEEYYQERKDTKASGQRSRDHSRESSREPMQIDDVSTSHQEVEDDNGEDEVMESSFVEAKPDTSLNAVPLPGWGSTSGSSTATGASKDGQSAPAAPTPIPGASLWIFGNSLQEFKKAYESTPAAPETATMFRHIWEIFGDVAAASVEGSDIAQEIGAEICSIAKTCEIPESYLTESAPVGKDVGMLEPLMACLWTIAARDGAEGASRMSQVFLKSEATVEPSKRLLGMWLLVALVREQTRNGASTNMTLEQTLLQYGAFIQESATQDQSNRIEEDSVVTTSDQIQASARDYVLRDLERLHERQLAAFDTVLPLVLQYLPDLVPRTEPFLHLVVNMAVPQQIYKISMSLHKREYTLMSTPSPLPALSSSSVKEEKKGIRNGRATKKRGTIDPSEERETSTTGTQVGTNWTPKMSSPSLEILGRTLAWGTYYQLAIWQFLVSEIGGVSGPVCTLLAASWVPRLCSQTEAEALTGVQNLIRTLPVSPPDTKLGRALVWISSQTGSISSEMRELCESWVAHWLRTAPEQLSAVLISLSDKTAPPVGGSGPTGGSDMDVEMADVNSSKAKNTRTRNNNNNNSNAKVKLNPKQRKEQAMQLRVALSLLRVWWDSASPYPGSKHIFGRVWSQDVKNQVQEALVETFGAKESNNWPREWWRNATAEDRDGESEEDVKESESGDDVKADPSEEDDDKKSAGGDDQDASDQDRSSDDGDDNDHEVKGRGVKRSGGSSGSSRRNSPKLGSSTTSTTTKRASLTAGVLNSKSRKAKATPAAVKKAPARKGPSSRRRKVSEDEDDEDEEEDDQDEEDEEDEEEEEADDDDDGQGGQDDEDEDEEEEDEDTKKKTVKGKQPARRASTTSRSKAAKANTRSKAKTVTTRTGRRKAGKKDDDDDEEESDGDEDRDEEDDEDGEAKNGDQDDDDEEQDVNQDPNDNNDEDEDEEEEEVQAKGKLPIYSQRKAAASANSKLRTKPSPTSSSSSGSSPGSRSKSATTTAAKRRGKRRLPSDEDDEDDD
ncbi:Integrator complex subunit 3 [Mortierella alpina]|nr:Integrator complex subunit 3 [Mortierella alpina]